MFRSVCCCLPGRKPDYLQASETSHLLGASPSTEQPTAADGSGDGEGRGESADGLDGEQEREGDERGRHGPPLPGARR